MLFTIFFDKCFTDQSIQLHIQRDYKPCHLCEKAKVVLFFLKTVLK